MTKYCRSWNVSIEKYPVATRFVKRSCDAETAMEGTLYETPNRPVRATRKLIRLHVRPRHILEKRFQGCVLA